MRKQGLKSRIRGVRGRNAARPEPSGSEKHPNLDQLRRVHESALPNMVPGDVFLLDEALGSEQSLEGIFIAVLACPFCGSPALITPAQYFGAVPVMCGNGGCFGFFRVVNGKQLIYPRVN